MADDEEHNPGHWRKRLGWCRCESPAREAIDAITSLCVEGALSALEAKVELLEQKIEAIQLHHEAETLLKRPDEIAQEFVRNQLIREDLYIALEFADEVQRQNLQTPAMRQRLLEDLIRQHRKTEKGVD